MAEVAVDKTTGKIRVKRVVCAQDMGQVVNPLGAAAQMEGFIIMGLGYALSEEIRFRDGQILDINFDSYEIPRFSWVPEIDTVLVANPDLSPKGGGKPAINCMGGVNSHGRIRCSGRQAAAIALDTHSRCHAAARDGSGHGSAP